MEEKKQNEELKNRREFFKEAAKKALPIIGAVILAKTPLLAQAANSQDENMGCNYSCSGGCSGGCSGYCGYGCTGSCKGGCGGCKGACRSSCTSSAW